MEKLQGCCLTNQTANQGWEQAKPQRADSRLLASAPRSQQKGLVLSQHILPSWLTTPLLTVASHAYLRDLL